MIISYRLKLWEKERLQKSDISHLSETELQYNYWISEIEFVIDKRNLTEWIPYVSIFDFWSMLIWNVADFISWKQEIVIDFSDTAHRISLLKDGEEFIVETNYWDFQNLKVSIVEFLNEIVGFCNKTMGELVDIFPDLLKNKSIEDWLTMLRSNNEKLKGIYRHI